MVVEALWSACCSRARYAQRLCDRRPRKTSPPLARDTRRSADLQASRIDDYRSWAPAGAGAVFHLHLSFPCQPNRLPAAWSSIPDPRGEFARDARDA